MISTDTATTSACASCGGGPTRPTTSAATTAIDDDRRHEPRRDAIGEPLHGRARALRLRDHVHDLREQRLAADALGAHQQTCRCRSSCRPTAARPSVLRTGSGSPVSIDSSTWLEPSTTTPSTGMFSPGPHAQPIADLRRARAGRRLRCRPPRRGARSSARASAARGSRPRSARARAARAPARAARA